MDFFVNFYYTLNVGWVQSRKSNTMNKDVVEFFGGVILAAVAVLLVTFVDLPVDAAVRDRAACGSLYRVAPGDTLHRIATRAYGTGDYQAIFEANRDTLTSASSIKIGDELLIPCLDGARPRARAVTLATSPVVMPDDGRIDLLTGSDFAPFVHSALPEGGMITELLQLAMPNAARERSVKIALVEDWSTHLDLLEEGAFDLGFPWYRPDCSRVEKLGPSMRRRCAGFDFSDPLFEVVIGYYVRAGDALADATGYDRLSGRRLCRPANYFTFDLEQEGLVEPNATLVIAPESSDCFIWLERGEVDVVTLSKPLAEADFTRLGLYGRVVEIPALASGQTLHVVAPKGHPRGRAYLDRINAGLADLRASGRRAEVVSRHFGAFGVSMR